MPDFPFPYGIQPRTFKLPQSTVQYAPLQLFAFARLHHNHYPREHRQGQMPRIDRQQSRCQCRLAHQLSHKDRDIPTSLHLPAGALSTFHGKQSGKQRLLSPKARNEANQSRANITYFPPYQRHIPPQPSPASTSTAEAPTTVARSHC